jgi:hypothetical protein
MIIPINKNKAKEWTSTDALDHVKGAVSEETPVIALYLDEDGCSQWAAANLDNHTLLWILETTKMRILTEE